MITGSVSGLQVRVGIPFRLAHGPDLEIEFVIDTGFEGALTVPVAAIEALRLTFYQQWFANLADGTNVAVDVYRATIIWDGGVKHVAVLAMGMRPLVGAALLDGYDFFAEFRPNGRASLHIP
jgi:clan AA aspartic protease